MTKNSSSMSPCMKNMSRAMAEAHETDVGREDEPRVGHARGFPEELQDVVEGLEQRRPLPGLETGRQASVHPGEKSARGNGYSDCDEGENELQH